MGWKDNSPTSIDSNRSDVYKDELGNIELMVSSVYGKDGRLLLLENKEWYRYTIDIPRAGYYSVLGEIHHAQAKTPFSITVNDDPANSNTLNINLDESCTNYVEPFTDCGLLYFNEGKNTLIFKNEHTEGYVTLGALRIVSPDIALYSTVPAETKTVSAIDNTGVGEKTYPSGYKETGVSVPVGSIGFYATHDASYDSYITWTIEVPFDGNYELGIISSGGYSNHKGWLTIDDESRNATNKTATVSYTANSGYVNMGTVSLTGGEHTITYHHGNYGAYATVSGLTYTIPVNLDIVKSVTDGTYNAVVDVTDWYAGATICVDYYTGPDIYWNAKDSNEMQDLAVVLSVYDDGKLVNAYFNNEISKTTNATNSKLYDYKITIEDIVVEDGQYVKLFVLDNGTMTPLADYTIYE